MVSFFSLLLLMEECDIPDEKAPNHILLALLISQLSLFLVTDYEKSP